MIRPPGEVHFPAGGRVLARTSAPIEICEDEPVVTLRADAWGWQLYNVRIVSTERPFTAAESAAFAAWATTRPGWNEDEILEATEDT